MKIRCLIFLTMLNLAIYGQSSTKPRFFLDSLEINYDKTYINPNSIESINISRNTKNGEVYITAKKTIKLNTLKELLAKTALINNISASTIVNIDGKTITNLSDLKIDDSYYTYFDLETFSDVDYISKKFKEIQILYIELETEKRKPKIYIRGEKSKNNLKNNPSK